jgi:hypothetical protein
VIVVETQKQHVGVGVTRSLGVGITTTRVEMVVAPNINVVKRGILIGFVAKLGNGLGGVLAIRNLSQSLALLETTTRVIGIFQMVFINPIMTIHVNRTIDRLLVNSMDVGRYKSINVVHPRRRY